MSANLKANMANDDDKIIYKDLSYKITGAAFNVFNKIGYGLNEKYYQKALALELDNLGISYIREKQIKIDYGNQNIGSYFADFIVDDKIVVELKTKPRFGYVHIRQVVEYLDKFGKKLAIIIYFTRDGVHYRRIINPRI